MPAPRVVVDSNALISGIGFGGKPEAVVRLACAGAIELYLSFFLLEEVARILREKLEFSAADVEEFLALLPYRDVDPGDRRVRRSRDPGDDPKVTCAAPIREDGRATARPSRARAPRRLSRVNLDRGRCGSKSGEMSRAPQSTRTTSMFFGPSRR